MRQVANLRVGYAMVHGEDTAQEEYERRCEAARAAQGVRYAVAPSQTITTSSGRTLREGDEVRVQDFVSTTDTPAWRQLERLVQRGIVLEAYHLTDGPSAA